MNKQLGTAAVAGVLALAAAACGSSPDAASSGGPSAGARTQHKACMVSDAGGFQDQSFTQSGLEGLQRAAKERGMAPPATRESRSTADFVPNIASLVQQGCDLVISGGSLLADATGSAADQDRDVHFAIVDATVDPARDNVKPLLFDTAQASFLAGYVAAGTTRTGTVATYGGQKIPSVTVFMDGFVDGVAYYDQRNGRSVKVLGWDKASQKGSFTGDFEDAAKGARTTKGFIDRGADIVLPVAGPVGAGTLAAASAARRAGKDVEVIWVDGDGYQTVDAEYRSLLLTSVVKKVGAAVGDAVTAAARGSFDAQPYVGTLANGGVDLAPFHDLDGRVPRPVKDGVAQLRRAIISGQVRVTSPSTP